MSLKPIISNLVLAYFCFFARFQLLKNPHATIIGVTGSAGKTSTRLAIVHILATHGRVKHSLHANSESGIPLNILALTPHNYSFLDWLRLIVLAPLMLLFNWQRYDYYVVEMGIDSPTAPKNMAYLLSIIRPHIGVVLNAGLTHSMNFDHLVKDTSPSRRTEKIIRLIAREKMQLVQSLPKTGVAVINLDQKELMAQRQGIIARQITFGKSERADLQILPNYHFRYQGITHQLVVTDIFPDHFAYTFAAAIAAAAAVGLPPTISLPILSTYRAPAGRLRIFAGLHDSTIIDSSYNASPATMLESLKLLRKLALRRKKIAVVGDMRELGLSEKIAHKNLADWLLQYCDEAILYGPLTRVHTLPVLTSHKFPVHHFAHMSDLTKYLRAAARPKSYILVKGSQNTIFLERAVASILQNPADVSQLCRRGLYWDKIRRASP